MAFAPRSSVVGGRDLIEREHRAHARRLGEISMARSGPGQGGRGRGGRGGTKSRKSAGTSLWASSRTPDNMTDTTPWSLTHFTSQGDGAMFEGIPSRETLVAHMLQHAEGLEAQYERLIESWRP